MMQHLLSVKMKIGVSRCPTKYPEKEIKRCISAPHIPHFSPTSSILRCQKFYNVCSINHSHTSDSSIVQEIDCVICVKHLHIIPTKSQGQYLSCSGSRNIPIQKAAFTLFTFPLFFFIKTEIKVCLFRGLRLQTISLHFSLLALSLSLPDILLHIIYILLS